MLAINCSVSSSKIKTNTTSTSVFMTRWVSLTTHQPSTWVMSCHDRSWQACSDKYVRTHQKFQTYHSTNICIPSFCHIPEAMQELKPNVGQHSE
jgi:hypothetical protein